MHPDSVYTSHVNVVCMSTHPNTFKFTCMQAGVHDPNWMCAVPSKEVCIIIYYIITTFSCTLINITISL